PGDRPHAGPMASRRAMLVAAMRPATRALPPAPLPTAPRARVCAIRGAANVNGSQRAPALARRACSVSRLPVPCSLAGRRLASGRYRLAHRRIGRGLLLVLHGVDARGYRVA